MPPQRSAAAASIASTSASSATFTRTANASPVQSATVSSARLQVHVRDAHLGALGGEDDRRLAAHPAARTRDHAHLAVEPAAHCASVERKTFLTSE